MKKFAKLFEHEKYGQILIVKKQNEESQPIISWSYKPSIEEIDLIELFLIYNDSDEGQKTRDEHFEKFDIQKAVKLVEESEAELKEALK